MQIFKLSNIFLAFIFLTACATSEPFVAKERNVPPEINEIDETILFEFDSDVISDVEMAKIEDLLTKIANQTLYLIEIHGHADEIGHNTYNMELAKRRAESVKKIFENLSTTLPPIKLFSWGEEIPKEEGETKQVHRKNRRVEIVILP